MDTVGDKLFVCQSREPFVGVLPVALFWKVDVIGHALFLSARGGRLRAPGGAACSLPGAPSPKVGRGCRIAGQVPTAIALERSEF